MSGVARTAWVDRKRLRGYAWVWLAIGLPTLAIGMLLLLAAGLFEAQAGRAEGVVVGHAGGLGQGGPGRNASNERDVVPIVRYALDDGVPRELHGMHARGEEHALPIGQRVAVRYQRMPDGRVSARIASVAGIWGIPLSFALFGGAFSVCGVIGLRASRGGA